MKKGFRFTFPDERHVKLTAVTPVGEMSVTLTWAEMDEVMVQVMRRMGDTRAREFPVEIGEEDEQGDEQRSDADGRRASVPG